MKNIYTDHSRNFENNKYCYPVISRRAKGLSLGINLNLNGNCSFHCAYCQVDRQLIKNQKFDFCEFEQELQSMIEWISTKAIFSHPKFVSIDSKQKVFRDIAIAGNGEPTLSPFLPQTINLIQKLSKQYNLPQLVLFTNCTNLHQPKVQQCLTLLEQMKGIVWAKLDAGTEAYFKKINNFNGKLQTITTNISNLSPKLRLNIQTCLMAYQEQAPTIKEIIALKSNLNDILQKHPIETLQIYTIARDPNNPNISALKMNKMKTICKPLNDLPIKIELYSGMAD